MQDYSVARRAMVDSQLRPQGVTDRAVLAAMASVPRERFVPAEAAAFAYFDRPVRLSAGRTLMPPAALGRLLSELAPKAGEKALIVGAGSGYSAALLSQIGLDVTAIDSDAGLVALATEAGVAVEQADLTKGSPKRGPFDLILVDGAVEQVPDAIVAQLSDGGRLAAAIVDRGVTRLSIGRNTGASLALASIVDADVSPLPGFEKPKAFTF